MLVYLFLFTCLHYAIVEGDLHRVVRQAAYSYCTTPNNEPGTCILLTSCQTLSTLVRIDGRNGDVVAYLRNSRCGFQNQAPKVCCPTSTNASVITPTPKTARARIPVTPSNPATPRQLVTPPLTRVNDRWAKCGTTNNSFTKIVGGKPAVLGTWPWMVALGYRTATRPGPIFQCGASLIANKWVITAAHCVQNLPVGQKLTVARLGDLDLKADIVDGATPIDAAIEHIIPHPRYSTAPLVNDIALLELRDPVQFTRLIRPICLLSGETFRANNYYLKKRPYITGWGRIVEGGVSSTALQETSVEVVNNTYCAQQYAAQRSALIDETVLCAGDPGKDTCQGDSGGPLMIPITEARAFYLAGIVSYGVGCANPNYPGVYTRVAAFTDWVSQVTGLNF